MLETRTDNAQLASGKALNLLIPVFALWGGMLIAGLLFFWAVNDFGTDFGDYYLIPWTVIAAIAILGPSAFFFFRGGQDAFHPLVFGVWTYIFPAFVLGGFILSFGLSDPYYLVFIENPRFNLPYALFLVVLGYLSVAAGFYLPFNGALVRKIDRALPDWDWEPRDVWLPGVVLMILGIGFNLLGFVQGILGYQVIVEIGMFDGLLFFLTVIYSIGNLLLWFAVFQEKDKSGMYYLILATLILLIPMKMALMGSRGSLLLSILPVIMAFWYSGRRLLVRHYFVIGGVLVLAIAFGIIYGTAFRNIKGSEARVGAGDYAGQVGETIDYLSRTSTLKILNEGSRTLFERIENLSALGVVVANYEKLEPYEESYGLKNNIYNDLVTAFVPRFLWPDKPSTSDPRAYSDLYFNYDQNSFAITSFGDLLRNFGIFGVPIGMMIVGFYLRLIYSTLIETDRQRIWKKVVYFMLLTVVSYEAFYATMFPLLLRTGVIIAVCLIIINLFTPSRLEKQASTA